MVPVPESPQCAKTILAEYLASVGDGEEPSVEALCARHPGFADELRGLWAQHERLGEILPGGSSGVAVGGGTRQASGDDGFAEEIVRRLSARGAPHERYQLRGELARGGQGVIVRVWDDDLRRNLAMKVVLGGEEGRPTKTPPVDSRTLGRFLDEAQVMGQLDHPGIVPIHELGLGHDGRAYFTMKLVRGRDLKAIFDLVKRGEEGWTMTRALGVLLKVCEAMEYAHEKGVVHRDLKPGNVMVGRHGEAYVMDWGLARVLGRPDHKDIRLRPQISTADVRSDRKEMGRNAPDSPLQTMDGDVVGTPAYMPPEQAHGDIKGIGPHSDVYSVGAMLYHLLAGHMPYLPAGRAANNYAVWQWVQQGPPEPVGPLAPGAPAALVAICEKAMRRDRAERYTAMADLANDLRAYLEDRVVAAHRTGPWAEARMWIRRNGLLARALLVAMILLLVATAATSLLYVSATRDRDHATRSAYIANMRAAQVSIETGEGRRAQIHLNRCPEERRGWEWQHLTAQLDQSIASAEVWDPPLGEPRTVLRRKSAFTQPPVLSLARDGSTLVVGLHDGSLHVFSRNLNKIRMIQGHEGDISALAHHPDGELLASGGHDKTICIWDLTSGSLVVRLRGHRFAPSSILWSGGGEQLVSATDATMYFEEPSSPHSVPLQVTGDKPNHVDQVMSRERFIRVWDVESQSEIATLRDTPRARTTLGFWEDGRFLVACSSSDTHNVYVGEDRAYTAVSSDHTTLRTWDITSDDWWSLEPSRVTSVEYAPTAAAISPHGMVFFGDSDGKVSGWDGDDATLFLSGGHSDSVTAFDVAGDVLATGGYDGTVCLWNRTTGEFRGALLGHATPVHAVAMAATARRLFSIDADANVRCWDPTETRPMVELHDFSNHAGAYFTSDMSISRDGEYVAYGDLDGQGIHIRDLENGKLVDLIVPEHPHLERFGIMRISFTESSDALVLGMVDGSAGILDLKTGTLRLVDYHDAQVVAVAASRDGSQCATGSRDRSAVVWDRFSGAVIADLSLEGSADCVVFVAEQRIVVGASQLVCLDLPAGTPVWERPDIRNPTALAFLPEKGVIGCGDRQGGAQIIDAHDGRTVTVFDGHGHGVVYGIAFQPGGDRVATAGSDSRVRLWLASTGEELLALAGRRGAWLGAAGFGMGGDQVLALELNGGPVLMWDSDRDRLQSVRDCATTDGVIQSYMDALHTGSTLTAEVRARFADDSRLMDGERSAAVNTFDIVLSRR